MPMMRKNPNYSIIKDLQETIDTEDKNVQIDRMKKEMKCSSRPKPTTFDSPEDFKLWVEQLDDDRE